MLCSCVNNLSAGLNNLFGLLIKDKLTLFDMLHVNSLTLLLSLLVNDFILKVVSSYLGHKQYVCWYTKTASKKLLKNI
jgi:uncharacterized protein YaaW (UPF0174 family)